MTLFVISGRSGSGKSTMLHALEDAGYKSIDNFPASLLEQLVSKENQSVRPQKLAVCIDVRNAPLDLEVLPQILAKLRERGTDSRVIYLDAQSSVLVKRFSDTRRRHPLDSPDIDLREAIVAESEILRHVAEMADLKIDTTNLSVHDLVVLTTERVARETVSGISLLFRSFGYKSGVPVDADFLFDARCLPNPYWEQELRPLTGMDGPVAAFLDESTVVREYFDDVCAFLDKWLPVFSSQNRVYVTVAVGCTGGRHRSVYMAERLAKRFLPEHPATLVRHREFPESR